ncbi:hypothetical protein GBA52_004363 [Prunus armeniaca]|nr:hypothetical protein GBA52_004363 [Prunus armeniaca]
MGGSGNERLDFGKMGYGCKHYRRRCQIRAPCCNEIYPCRHCHNEATSMLSNPFDRHELVRYDVKQVVCSVCDTEQPVARVCTNCGVSMGEYFCEICKFYDDDVSLLPSQIELPLIKGNFIVMIVGSAELAVVRNSITARSVGLAIQLVYAIITCVWRTPCGTTAPFVMSSFFDSLKDTTVMKCGHTMHCECYNEMMKRDKYCCPICSKSVIDMSRTWRRIDEEIEATAMPEDYRYKKVLTFHPSLALSLSLSLQNSPSSLGAPKSDWTRSFKAMQVVSNTRRLSRALKSPIFIKSDQFLSPDVRVLEAPLTSFQWRNLSTVSSQNSLFSGITRGYLLPMEQHTMCTMMTLRAPFSSEVSTVEGGSTEVVKELYDKMLQSVNIKRSMPPNAWLWSLIENCKKHEDIKLLFDILQNLRRFRLSNLRIHSDFNCNLCREVTKACARVGALDFGKKALWKHNVYGLAPTIGSAHHLLIHAKERGDAKLMMEIMSLLKKNDLPLQPGTADIVFSICYNTDNWQLMSKYSKRFVKAGVKLRQTAFDLWMEFAAKIGDVESLWKIEKLRSESMKQHTVASGFSCAKGFLLEHKPEEAASIIQVLNQTLPDAKKSSIVVELQKLGSEWPLEVIRHQKEEDRKALAVSLTSDIPAMVHSFCMQWDMAVVASLFPSIFFFLYATFILQSTSAISSTAGDGIALFA